jgi:hypothetical protein
MIPVVGWAVMASIGMTILVTVQLVLYELYQRPPERFPNRWCAVLNGVRWVSVFFLAFITSFLLPPQFGVLAFSMGLALLIHAIVTRRLEDAELLEALTSSIVAGKGSVPDAFERFAGDRRNSIARRCRDFAYQLRSGIAPVAAAKKSRLPLSVDSLLKLSDGQANMTPEVSLDSYDDSIASFTWASWPIANQLIYLGSLFCLLIVGPLFSTSFVVPVLVSIFDEMGVAPPAALKLVDPRNTTMLWMIAQTVLMIAALWLGLILLCWIYPATSLLNVTPWYGGWIRARSQYHGLRSLAASLRSGRPLVDSMAAVAVLTRYRWTARRARLAKRMLESGHAAASALQRSGWINQAEGKWVAAAEALGNLPTTLDTLANQNFRRYELIWRIRLSWLIPLAVVALGLFVSLFIYAVVGALASLIDAQA